MGGISQNESSVHGHKSFKTNSHCIESNHTVLLSCNCYSPCPLHALLLFTVFSVALEPKSGLSQLFWGF